MKSVKPSCQDCGYEVKRPGRCVICEHLEIADRAAKKRYPEKGDQALNEVLFKRYRRKSSTVQET